MKNKKGFTLIELLAVIVILAIIALIAVPKILNMIEDSRKNASLDSAYGYIDAIEKQNALAYTSEKYEKIEDGTEISVLDINRIVNIKGTKPVSGNVTILKGRIKEARLCINKYLILYNGTKASVHGTNCKAEIVEISASEVSFTPEDTSWKVSTVEEALDDLYNK